MASDDYVNYAIRPNKTVERKLIFETLVLLDPVYNFAGYRYIGFGALWFVDFVLAHKYLSIEDMVSIEEDEYIASRAKFNKPYACVRVEPGKSNSVLPNLQLKEKRLLVWLDYTKSIDGPVFEDLTTLCQHALAGSLFIVTINAHKNSLPNKDADDREFKDDQEMLSYFAGDLIPPTLPKGAMQASNYPAFLASLLFKHMHRQVRIAGRSNDSIVPIFNIKYQDNAPMVTVGAVIADEQYAQKTAEIFEAKNSTEPMDENKQLSIGVPPLTLKEKASLDQLMPCDSAPTAAEISELGFRMKPSQIEAYHRFYRYYPMFGEVTI